VENYNYSETNILYELHPTYELHRTYKIKKPYNKWTNQEFNVMRMLSSIHGVKKLSLSWDRIAEDINYLFGTNRTGNACSKNFHTSLQQPLRFKSGRQKSINY